METNSALKKKHEIRTPQASPSDYVERIMFVDPGLSAGWCVLEIDHAKRRGKIVDAGVVEAEGDTWLEKMDWVVDDLGEIAWRLGAGGVVSEQPEVFMGGRGGAAQNSGAILKLQALVFSLRMAMLGEGLGVELVPVRKWKGTVPKHITQKRVRSHFGFEHPDHNCMDAVAIGLYWVRRHLKYAAVRGK